MDQNQQKMEQGGKKLKYLQDSLVKKKRKMAKAAQALQRNLTSKAGVRG